MKAKYVKPWYGLCCASATSLVVNLTQLLKRNGKRTIRWCLPPINRPKQDHDVAMNPRFRRGLWMCRY